MQPIQDKDFDQLFKSTFEHAEIMPSKDLWASVEQKIEARKKRIVPIYWLSAAAVLLFVAAGILVYQQQEHKPEQVAVHETPKPIVEDSVKTASTAIDKTEYILPAGLKPTETIAKKQLKADPLVKQSNAVTEVQKHETAIAKVEEPKQDINKKIEEIILQPKEETVMASVKNAVKTDEVIGDDNAIEDKGIRNVGDVVNLIVNKVDKRKDKFIQFRTDDDDSSLSSINIGPFKFGKRNKK